MMQREDVKGVIAFLPTAFTASGEIDEDANRANVRILVEEGIPIIQAAGGAAEFYSLTLKEHETMARLVAEETGGKAGANCGCGTVMSTMDAIERVSAAAEAGVGSAMLVTPHYFAARPSEVIKFFEDVAAAVPNIGLMHYNTALAKVKLEGEHYRELAKIPTFIGVKHSTSDIFEWFLVRSLSPELPHFVTDCLWVPAMMNGCPAADCVLAATRPKAALRLWDLCAAKEWGQAMAFQRAVWRLCYATNCLPEAEARYGDCSVDKGVVQAAGTLRVGAPRLPYVPVDQALIDLWAERFREFDEGQYED